MNNLNSGCSTSLAKNDSTLISAKLKRGCTLLLLAVTLFATSCNNDRDDLIPIDPVKIGSVYVLNEGNWGASNASLTVYSPETENVEPDIFAKANGGASFGDVPTSMTMIDGKAFFTISNSGKIYILDPHTGQLTGKITGLNSPRYIEVINPEKAYVSNLNSDVIDIINPKTQTKTGQISLGEGHYAEQFVRLGSYVYTNLWSYGNQILKIDPATDKIVGSLEVGVQPIALFRDKSDNLWTMTDGGYQGHPVFELEDPALVCVNTQTFTVAKKIKVPRARAIMYKVAMDTKGENLYYIDLNIYKISITATELPKEPFISYKEADNKVHNFYALGVNPDGGDIYLGDAIDFVQEGQILRYNDKGEKLASFKAGIIPGGFGFVPQK